jgi:hypothetical protein
MTPDLETVRELATEHIQCAPITDRTGATP